MEAETLLNTRRALGTWSEKSFVQQTRTRKRRAGGEETEGLYGYMLSRLTARVNQDRPGVKGELV